MILTAKIISWLSLIAVIAPSIMFMAGRMELPQVKNVMLIATIVWFVSAYFWMWHKAEKS